MKIIAITTVLMLLVFSCGCSAQEGIASTDTPAAPPVSVTADTNDELNPNEAEQFTGNTAEETMQSAAGEDQIRDVQEQEYDSSGENHADFTKSGITVYDESYLETGISPMFGWSRDRFVEAYGTEHDEAENQLYFYTYGMVIEFVEDRAKEISIIDALGCSIYGAEVGQSKEAILETWGESEYGDDSLLCYFLDSEGSPCYIERATSIVMFILDGDTVNSIIVTADF